MLDGGRLSLIDHKLAGKEASQPSRQLTCLQLAGSRRPHRPPLLDRDASARTGLRSPASVRGSPASPPPSPRQLPLPGLASVFHSTASASGSPATLPRLRSPPSSLTTTSQVAAMAGNGLNELKQMVAQANGSPPPPGTRLVSPSSSTRRPAPALRPAASGSLAASPTAATSTVAPRSAAPRTGLLCRSSCSGPLLAPPSLCLPLDPARSTHQL